MFAIPRGLLFGLHFREARDYTVPIIQQQCCLDERIAETPLFSRAI